MDFPNFHDGSFDGFRIKEAEGVIDFFLTTVDKKVFTLTFYGVERMNLSDVWEGSSIFDLLFRDGNSITLPDLAELYHGSVTHDEGAALLASIRERELKVMEMNTSYGAHGSVLFERHELVESSQ